MNIESITKRMLLIAKGCLTAVILALVFSVISRRIEAGTVILLGFYCGYLVSTTKDHMESYLSLTISALFAWITSFVIMIIIEPIPQPGYILGISSLSTISALITIFYLFDFEKMWKQMSERSYEEHIDSIWLNKK